MKISASFDAKTVHNRLYTSKLRCKGEAYLQKEGVTLSPKVYFVEALNFMAFGLFNSLIIGLIIKTVGEQFDIPFPIETGN